MRPGAVMATLRAERMHARAIGFAVATLAAALVIALVAPRGELVTAALLGAGIVVGELFVLRWPPAGELPLSYAVFPVVARGLDIRYALVTVVLAELVTLAGDEASQRSGWRVTRGIAVGAAIVIAYHAAFAVVGRDENVAIVAAALLFAIAIGSA